MQEGTHFVGVGATGNRTAMELRRIYEGICDGLFYDEHDHPENHLHIHSYPCDETFCCDGGNPFIILAGSVHDLGLRDARKSLHESRPYFFLTIGIDYQEGMDTDTYQPFPDECLVLPDPSLHDPVKLAQLVLQIFLIHTPWYISKRGSLIGYDLYDTKQMFAEKTAKVRTLTADKKHFRESFTRFLGKHKEDLRRTQGILISFSGLPSIREVDELYTETTRLLKPDVGHLLTYQDSSEDEPESMATLFFTL